MALQKLHFSNPTKPNHSHPLISTPPLNKPIQMSVPSRRSTLLLSLFSILNSNTTIKQANAFDFSLTVPDQTIEEAENSIKFHAQSLLQVKETLDLESWKEAQKDLRQSSALLKQDIYTLIQSKPPTQRPLLRKLYFNLFNSVSELDYAARDKDLTRVHKCYDNIVVALNKIFSELY